MRDSVVLSTPLPAQCHLFQQLFTAVSVGVKRGLQAQCRSAGVTAQAAHGSTLLGLLQPAPNCAAELGREERRRYAGRHTAGALHGYLGGTAKPGPQASSKNGFPE